VKPARAALLGLALALGLPALASTRLPAPVAAPATAEPAASAVGEGEGVRARLAQPAVLRGQFEQSKQLEGFRQPLVSRGDFLLVRERGVAWDTREPFASTTLLTRDRLLTRLPDGSQRVLLDAGESPGMAAVNALLLALVAGDLPALTERFALQETLAPGGSWRLVLTPEDAGLRQAFNRITLAGDCFVREVVIEEAGGDVTTLRFLALADTPATPTPGEAARFD
jgi:hypothetical protein